MIFPCIDLMDGKVVQLIAGREKALEAEGALEMVKKFAAFPEIQVIDLDAAMGRGNNDSMVEEVTRHAKSRVGGGIRTVERAARLIDCGAQKVIIGTAAFDRSGLNRGFLSELAAAIGTDRIVIALDSREGRIVVSGWQESTTLTAVSVVRDLEPYCSGFLCTYVDREGMMCGTDLAWYRSLRGATSLELTAAGGVTTLDEIRELHRLGIHAALGMAIYTGRLELTEVAGLARLLSIQSQA